MCVPFTRYKMYQSLILWSIDLRMLQGCVSRNIWPLCCSIISPAVYTYMIPGKHIFQYGFDLTEIVSFLRHSVDVHSGNQDTAESSFNWTHDTAKSDVEIYPTYSAVSCLLRSQNLILTWHDSCWYCL